jgi:predicted pyridoxine 5'-phosphate oxidase superfamily flavin-nucleotide-binding protein
MSMMFIATADLTGAADCSVRCGPPGFVRVFGPRLLGWPEYRGNGVAASAGNITETGQAGLLFLDLTRDLIGLHVNGEAHVTGDAQMREAHPQLPAPDIPGRKPQLWVTLAVAEAYIHCSKHLPRFAEVPRNRDWGTDDARRKGGDYFGATRSPPPWKPGPRVSPEPDSLTQRS